MMKTTLASSCSGGYCCCRCCRRCWRRLPMPYVASTIAGAAVIVGVVVDVV